jgi:two-component system response regulator RegX3
VRSHLSPVPVDVVPVLRARRVATEPTRDRRHLRQEAASEEHSPPLPPGSGARSTPRTPLLPVTPLLHVAGPPVTPLLPVAPGPPEPVPLVRHAPARQPDVSVPPPPLALTAPHPATVPLPGPPGAGRDRRPVVLVVDDEDSYRQALASGLAQEGFVVELAADGHEALSLFHRVRPDLVLLDVLLPDQSGVQLCQRMRAARPVPIIMVTARDSEVDVVVGLEVGAADYVAKPFHLRELVARMRAVLRRGVPAHGPQEEVLVQGPVRLDTARRKVTVGGRPIELSRKEFDLLALLVARSGQVVTRDWCINRLWWDQELADSRTLDTHVKRLRRKIEPDPAHPRHLVTVRGVGFRFEP